MLLVPPGRHSMSADRAVRRLSAILAADVV
jgi:hypothetical protein